MIEFLKRDNAPDLAYVSTAATDLGSHLPTIVFLGGFRSDMQGTKAQYFEAECKKRGQGYVRFDYRGHGDSGGAFENSCITDWLRDALDIVRFCTSGSIVLVGSSMGGWISLLTALQVPDRVHALVGLAAAPDFTLWMEEGMSELQKQQLEDQGFFELANDYDDPYIITRELLEDGRQHSLLKGSIDLHCPVHLIQGKKDDAVPWQVAEKIQQAVTGQKVDVTLLEEADHRLSSTDELKIINDVICKLSGV